MSLRLDADVLVTASVSVKKKLKCVKIHVLQQLAVVLASSEGGEQQEQVAVTEYYIKIKSLILEDAFFLVRIFFFLNFSRVVYGTCGGIDVLVPLRKCFKKGKVFNEIKCKAIS